MYQSSMINEVVCFTVHPALVLCFIAAMPCANLNPYIICIFSALWLAALFLANPLYLMAVSFLCLTDHASQIILVEQTNTMHHLSPLY
jgi:hypothetical protein